MQESVFEGRLDNREQLLRETGLASEPTVPDAALANRLYKNLGIRAFARLTGDWRAVVADEARRTCTLAVDHAGCRPLYYCGSGPSFRWSGALRDLTGPEAIHDLDSGFMAAWLTNGPAGTRTPFRGISSVAPGQAVTLSPDGAAASQYWTFPETVERISEAEAEDRLRSLFAEAVAVRLHAEGPVVAECSGGLDSSLVVCTANMLIQQGRIPGRELLAMHYAIEGSGDERFQKEVVRHCRIPLVRIASRDAPLLHEENSHPPLTPAIGAPRLRAVQKLMAAHGASMLLTGQLGDLVMGNYFDDYDQAGDWFRSGQFWKGVRESAAWSASQRYPVWRVLGRALRSAVNLSAPADWYAGIVRGDASVLSDRLQTEALDRAATRRRVLTRRDLAPSQQRRYHSLRDILDSGALRSSELLGTAVVSHPFAHRPLLEFLLRLPARYLCGPGAPRRLMRNAFAGVLPRAVLNRRSKASVTSALYAAARSTAARFLQTGEAWRVVAYGFADAKRLQVQLHRYMQGLPCAEHQIHQLVALEAWLRGHLQFSRHTTNG
ncbi:MAG TPA: asparagine synthase-related protein [Bryobacteraceae bacterium]|nr:asparagine synthase-related protein [Bryobacteraceae bacterium]